MSYTYATSSCSHSMKFRLWCCWRRPCPDHRVPRLPSLRFRSDDFHADTLSSLPTSRSAPILLIDVQAVAVWTRGLDQVSTSAIRRHLAAPGHEERRLHAASHPNLSTQSRQSLTITLLHLPLVPSAAHSVLATKRTLEDTSRRWPHLDEC